MSDEGRRDVTRLGVELHRREQVPSVNTGGLHVTEDEKDVQYDRRTVLWTAGSKTTLAPSAERQVPSTDRAGSPSPYRPDSAIEGHPQIFVVGDVMT